MLVGVLLACAFVVSPECQILAGSHGRCRNMCRNLMTCLLVFPHAGLLVLPLVGLIAGSNARKEPRRLSIPLMRDVLESPGSDQVDLNDLLPAGLARSHIGRMEVSVAMLLL